MVERQQEFSGRIFRQRRTPKRQNEREYQLSAKRRLGRLYREVVVQWQPFLGEGRRIYGPKVDIAVGPFAINQRYEDVYTALLRERRTFVERLIEKHNMNVEGIGPKTSFDTIAHFNENARCLFCIEVEDSGSRKHCLGNLINVSALGRIGLLVARRETVMRVFVRQRVYLQFLASVEKNTFRTDNALVLTAEQFDECLGSGFKIAGKVRAAGI
jgi:hypothetical protein